MAEHSEYKRLGHLRVLTLWAGCIGLFQSLVWIGLCITGIAAYNCAISYPITSQVSSQSVVGLVFYDLYFHSSSCDPIGYPTDVVYNNAASHLKGLTVLQPSQLFIWICVYLALCVVWFMASVLMVTNIRSQQIRFTNLILYMWIFITLCISAMDLSLGIIFGVDYGRLYDAASLQAFNSNPMFIAAQTVSISMMVMSFKGFIIWIINITFLCILFKETFLIHEAVRADTSYFNRAYSNGSVDSLNEADKGPITAFETQISRRETPQNEPKPKHVNQSFTNGVLENNTNVPNDAVNFDGIERASRMSIDNLAERRLRNLDSYTQYPATGNTEADAPFPAPDYTPPMPRSSRLYNGQLQNSRY